jgi:glycosyltransferase involved in cell wall biosynthesis
MLTRNIEISIVLPVFNEQELIGNTVEQLVALMKAQPLTFELIFVDDGSRDQSLNVLKETRRQYPNTVKILSLARNFGHQAAITAGLRVAQGQAVIVIDADLQDPPEVMLQFIDAWKNGYQVVYGVRSERQGETLFKKLTAAFFYKMIKAMTSIDIPENAGDFYLLDRKVVDILNGMEEKHRFIRGLIVWAGFKRLAIAYVRQPRLAGRTKFSVWKMTIFAIDAVTSFSFMPLRFISLMGMIISLSAFALVLAIFYFKFFTVRTVTGWSSLMAVVLFLGGIQMMSIGMIGEYLARIGEDIKRRPLYTVSEFLE